MEKMSKEQEAQILDSLRGAVADINAGVHPTEALYKIAQQKRFSPEIVKRAAEALNISRTLAHMKSASGTDRASSFPLADAMIVINRMYPVEIEKPAEKAAAAHVPHDYSIPETENFNVMPDHSHIPLDYKLAKPAAYAPDPNAAYKKAAGHRQRLLKAAEAARSEYRVRVMELIKIASELSAYFKTFGHEPFAIVEKTAFDEHGIVGRMALDTVYAMGGLTEKRAELAARGNSVFNASRVPYNLVDRMTKLAKEVNAAAESAVAAETALLSFCKESQLTIPEGVLKKQAAAPPECVLDCVLATEKTPHPFAKAAIDPSTIAMMGGMHMLGLKDPDPQKARQEALGEVFDPEHEAKMQAVGTQAMLNDFISNDPVLSSHDPADVALAYNQIAQLAPSVSQQPSVMRGMLRKMLQQGGVLEPFEAHQVSQIEKGLRPATPFKPETGGGGGGGGQEAKA